MRFYLADKERVNYELRAQWSGLSEPLRLGHFRLFNRNDGTTLHVRIIEQVLNQAEWIVECDEVPGYFAILLTRLITDSETPASRQP